MPRTITVYELRKNPSHDIQVTHSQSPNNARSESVISINPLNPNNIIAASKKFTNPATYEFSLAISYSFDAGLSWTESAPPALLQGWGGISDPAVTWDNRGDAYLVALPFPPGGGIATIGIAVYKSTDGGITWGNPVLIHSSSNDDKQWAAGDTSPQSPHYGNVYAAWDDGDTLRFARTTDGGTTWKGTGNAPVGSALANDSFSPELSVAADGTIYIVWLNGQSGSQIKFVKSTDGGNSFSAPQVAASGIRSLRGALPEIGGFPHFPNATFRVLTLATGCTGQLGKLVFAWADYREGVSRIYYCYSDNGGNTWLSPASGQPMLGPSIASELTMQNFHPQLISTPDGKIGCAFYEFGPKGAGNLIDVILVVSYDNGHSFSERITVTDQPWDPKIDAPHSHGDPILTFIGEYFGLDASSLGFFPLWTDTRTGIQELFTARVGIESRTYIAGGNVAQILVGIINDGGGIEITPSGQILRVPPRQPVFNILSGLVINEMASLIGSKEGYAIQRMAMDVVSKAAQQEIHRLDEARGERS